MTKKTSTGKNLQLRLGPQAHERLKQLASQREKSIADTIREAIEVYWINMVYAEKGKPLYWEGEKGEKTMVLIPGFNTQSTALVAPPSDKEH